MVIIFHDFAVEAKRLPDGGLSVKFLEAMEGEGPDGQKGIVGTGNEFATRMDRETAVNYVIELAVELGLMEDQDTPAIADMSQMREELEKHKSKKRKGRRRR